MAAFIILCWDSVEGYFTLRRGFSAGGPNTPLVCAEAPGVCVCVRGGAYHSILCHSHFLSKPAFPCVLPLYPPSGWVAFVTSLTLLFSDWLTNRPAGVQRSTAAPLFPLLFMWQRPELLKAGPPTKRRTNDWDRCQSNTQAFQRCKQIRACTKERRRSLFRTSTRKVPPPFPEYRDRTQHMHTTTGPLYSKEGWCVPRTLGVISYKVCFLLVTDF